MKILLIILSILLYSPANAAVLYDASAGVRLTHDAYNISVMGNGYAHYRVWNLDKTKIMIHEAPAEKNGITGRGWVVADASDLIAQSGGTQGDYEGVTTVLPDYTHITASPSITWSQVAGETNIIYATFYSGSNCTWLKRLDLDNLSEPPVTGDWTNIIRIDDETPSCRRALIIGWHTDGDLIVSSNREVWEDGAFKIDVEAPSKTFDGDFFVAPCTADYLTYPTGLHKGHGHSAIYRGSPGRWVDRCNETNESYFCYRDMAVGGTCDDILINDFPNGIATHVSWTNQDADWLVGSQGGILTAPPYLRTYTINQIIIDEVGTDITYNELLSGTSAGAYNDGDLRNFEAIPLVTITDDGTEIVYHSTDGKYSWDDCDNYDVAGEPGTCGNSGMWISYLTDPDTPPDTGGEVTGTFIGTLQ